MLPLPCLRSTGSVGTVLYVIHFRFVGLVEQLLKIDCFGRLVDGLLQGLPGALQLGGVARIVKGGRIKDIAMNATQDIAKGDFSGRPRQEVSAGFATLAFHDSGGFEFDQNLDEVIGGNSILRGHFFHGACAGFMKALGEPKDGANGVIALNGEFHGQKLNRTRLFNNKAFGTRRFLFLTFWLLFFGFGCDLKKPKWAAEVGRFD
jgi:hypothetical protein